MSGERREHVKKKKNQNEDSTEAYTIVKANSESLCMCDDVLVPCPQNMEQKKDGLVETVKGSKPVIIRNEQQPRTRQEQKKKNDTRVPVFPLFFLLLINAKKKP